MKRISLFNTLYYFYALLLGLVAAQIIATVQVYMSNIRLYDNLVQIQKAGYLPVPNQQIMPALQAFGPAFWGGLFFTFSIGAGIGLLSLAIAWIWDRLLRRNRNILILVLALWAVVLVAANSNGIDFFVVCYFLVIPTVVFSAAAMLMPQSTIKANLRPKTIHMIPIALLAILWATQVDRNVFVDMRDNLLFSNPVGMKLSNFYYQYTLYAAEAFKSLDQKLLKTYLMEGGHEARSQYLLEEKLIQNDYLPVTSDSSTDLHIDGEDDSLIFMHGQKEILRTSDAQFFSRPEETLSMVSQSMDTYATFRLLTFLSLIIGFPLAFFILTHSLITLFFSLFLDVQTSRLVATGLFFLIGLLLLVPVHLYRSSHITVDRLEQALESEHLQERLAALKYMRNHKIDPGQYAVYAKLLASPNTAERYWLVRTLGFSRGRKTYKDLLKFLDDPQLNVRSMAFHALGERQDPRAMQPILRHIQNSGCWYDQWYAYKALRALGWKQTKSR